MCSCQWHYQIYAQWAWYVSTPRTPIFFFVYSLYFYWWWNSIFIISEGTFTEQQSGEITFREISTPILEKVIQYFYYKVKYTNSTSEIPEFPIDPEIALELLMAANFLDT